MEEIVRRIISLDRENRRVLSRMIRANSNAWNAVFGIGEQPSGLLEGRIEGLVTDKGKLAENVNIIARMIEPLALAEIQPLKAASLKTATTTETVFTAVTDSKGYYSLNLPVGQYEITFENKGVVVKTIDNYLISTEIVDSVNAALI